MLKERKKLGKRLASSKKTVASYGCGLLCIAHCLCTGNNVEGGVSSRNTKALDPLVSGK